MKKGPFKMGGYSYPGTSPVKNKKVTQAERDAMTPAERLLAVVPNKDAYNKLHPTEQEKFNKAAKAAGLPTKRA